jgi:hypothetical protein
MNQRDLWSAIESKVKRRIPPPIRHTPEIRGKAEAILEDSDPDFSLRVEFEDLVKAVHERLVMIDEMEQLGRRRKSNRPGTHIEVAGNWSSASEEIYARGFSEYLASRALQKTAFRVAELWRLRDDELQESEIARFRRDFLSGHLLTKQAAHAFSNSPLLAICSLEDLHEEKIPIAEHQSELLSVVEDRSESGSQFLRLHLHVEWKGGEKDVSITHEPEFWPPMKEILEFPVDFLTTFPDITETKHRPWETSTHKAREIEVFPHSVLGNLKHVCEVVTRFFPWTESQTAWFTLTGMVPEVPPLRLSESMRGNPDYSYDQVKILVQPWVSGKTLLRAFTYLQRQIYGDLPDKKLLSEKVMRVFTFVNELRTSAPRMTWEAMHHAWAEKYPDDCYANSANFYAAYDRALDSLSRSKLVEPNVFSENSDRSWRAPSPS